MPALPGWYARIPEILASLAEAPPILDRPAFERLFSLRRRQAIRLMATSGGYQLGKTFLVERESLISYLEQIQRRPEARHATQRKQRIIKLLRHRVTIPSPPAISTPVPSELALAGVSKPGPGIVEIRYTGTMDLLAKVAALVGAATDDYPRFQAIFD